jgi:ubiquitin conjugation factor E4 B
VSQSQEKGKEKEKEKGEQKETDDKGFNFVTECFFLTHYCLHLGLAKVCDFYTKYSQAMGRLRREIRTMEQSQATSAALERKRRQFEGMLQTRLGMDAQLLDPDLLQAALSFYAFSAKWLCHLVDPQAKGLPLSAPSMEFCALPEFLVEDMVAFVLFVLRVSPEAITTSAVATALVEFLVLFLGSKDHIKNPYLRSQLVEVLYEFSPDADRDEFRASSQQQQLLRNSPLSFVFHQIDSNPIAVRFLTPALIRLYVDIETTGRHGQFFDKFFVRRHIALLLKYLRSLQLYQDAIKKFSLRESDLFVRFVHMLLTDAIFLLDEVIAKLIEIHEIQTAMQDRQTWLAQDESTQREREEQLSRNEGQTSTFGILGNETLHLLLYLSEQTPQVFLRPEMVDRIAAMLNDFVVKLSSQKCQDIQVLDPAKYHFTPREWLGRIVEIYLNFAKHQTFKEAVARDGRSFKYELFLNVVKFLHEHMLLPAPSIARFKTFITEASQLQSQEKDMEEELGEIPDDFLDPITCTLMEDPVILPTSGKVVDRATIARHLLSDGTDPFNRAKLTLEMLKPDTELKAKIEAFLKEKRGSKKE